MTAGRDERTKGWRPARAAAIAALAVLVTLADVSPRLRVSAASAQERPRTIMDMLFGGPPRRRYIDDPPPRRVIRQAPQVRRQKPARTTRQGGQAPAASTPAAVVAETPVVKSETAKTVLVVGDFLAGSLAGGLEDAVAGNPGIQVIGAANGSSGFVRDDHYDWLAHIGPLIDEKKPDVVVAMFGSNDRQPLTLNGKTLPPRSEGWTAEYERRAATFAETVKEKKVPLVWVGMPSFKFDRMSEDMATLNETYRKVAMGADGEFVDVWEGFVDANGAFAYSGPDIAGQVARLRNADGITMTPSGSEKLAFFAEKPILRLLGTTADGDGLPAPASGETPSLAAPPVADAANATSTPMLALNDPALDGGDALLGGGRSPAASQRPSPRDRLVVSGTLAPELVGRADDFNWSAKTTSVSPLEEKDSVIFRGSLDMKQVREPAARPPATPTPPLADAIIEDWAAGKPVARALAPSPMAPATAPAASAPSTNGVPSPGDGPRPVSASPFAQDQTPR